MSNVVEKVLLRTVDNFQGALTIFSPSAVSHGSIRRGGGYRAVEFGSKSRRREVRFNRFLEGEEVVASP
jgi:hypothetical protein